MKNAHKDQNNLLLEISDFNKNTKSRRFLKKMQKKDTLESLNALYEDRKIILNAFKSGIFSILAI